MRIRILKALLIILFVCSAICGFAETKMKTDFNVNIKITHQKSEDTWLVEYSLPEKVAALKFERQDNLFREGQWKALTEGLKIKKQNDAEIIVAENGESFDKVNLSAKSYYEHLLSDYTYTIPFSDGGVLLYTGHFNILPLDTKKNSNLNVITNFTFVSDGDEKILVDGKMFTSKAQWTGDSEGIYVYFGNLVPAETKYMIAILDPNLPQWMLDGVKDFFPKLVDFYTQKTKVALPFRPTVFISYKSTEISGFVTKGASLTGLIQLHFEGKEFNNEKNTPENVEKLFQFLAHESTHMWNSRVYHYDKDENSWMHEGGAEAFAWRALYHLNIIDKSALLKKHTQALNSCMLGLTKTSLIKSGEE